MPETIHDLMPETPDLNQERLAKLREILPDLFTDEGKLDEKQLKQIVEFASGDERPMHTPETYEFNWFGKAKAKEEAYSPTRLTLQYDPGRSFNPENSENVIIEGENLEVLKLLLCGYRGEIKCIYIDPPYNTGKDFVYSDKHAIEYKEYLEKTGKMRDGIKTDANADTSGRYHSDWLSMIYSRLIAAHQLLKNEGVLVVSIDDHEAVNLRKTCDEVFGPRNFVAQVAVQLNPRGRHLNKFFAQTHEYLVIYAKNIDLLEMNAIAKDDRMLSEYNKKDDRGPYRELELRNRNPAFNDKTRPKLYYPIYVNPNTLSVSLKKDSQHSEETLPKNSEGNPSCWTWGTKKFKKQIDAIVARKTSDDTYRIFRKDYLFDEDGEVATTLPKSLWASGELNNDYGKRAIKELLGSPKIFDFPKSPFLLERILEITTDPGDLVLDFFAGSGVTGHAAVQLCGDLKGTRPFILVQWPEATKTASFARTSGYKTVSDITIARVKAQIEAVKEDLEDSGPTNLDDVPANLIIPCDPDSLGFRAFTLEKSYFPRTEWTPEPGMDEAAKLASLRSYIAEKEGQQTLNYDHDKLLTEVLIKEGFKLTYKAVKRDDFTDNEVFDVTDGEREAVVCLDNALADSTVKRLRELIDKKVVVIERALDTTKKWNLHNALGERFKAF